VTGIEIQLSGSGFDLVTLTAVEKVEVANSILGKIGRYDMLDLIRHYYF
jgi:hypothetical protein